MSTTNDTPVEAIEAAILAAIPTNGDLVPWRKIRRQLPGSWWQHVMVSTALHDRGEVVITKVRGLNYLSRPLFPPRPPQRGASRQFVAI